MKIREFQNHFFLIFVSIGVIFLSGLISCALDYEQGSVEEEISGKTPNAIIYDLKRVNIAGSGEKIVVTAETSTFYRDVEETYFKNVEFYQQDKNSNLIRNGFIGEGILKTGDDAELRKGIRLYDKENKAEIEAEQLFWTNEKKLLETEGFVTVSQNDGTSIEGKGLEIDFTTNTISLSSEVQGIIQTEDE